MKKTKKVGHESNTLYSEIDDDHDYDDDDDDDKVKDPFSID